MPVSASTIRIKNRHVFGKTRNAPNARITDSRHLRPRLFPRQCFLPSLPPIQPAIDTWPQVFEPFGDRVREPPLRGFSFLDSRPRPAVNTSVVIHPSPDGQR